jgi:putative polyketide hydroxylase
MPPFKAGGANTAIQSADNLAWKLAAVLRGAAGPALLATYHDERYPVGRFAAHQSLSGPTMPLLRLDDDPPFLPPEEQCSMFNLLVGYRYRSAAVIAEGTGGPPGMELVEELRGQPGTRVPHAWVDRDGERVSTLDLLNCGFTLLTGDERWHDAAARASAALGVPIAVRCIRDREWLAVTRLRPGGALLVRPDDFVGWRADELPVDPERELHQALSAILAR